MFCDPEYVPAIIFCSFSLVWPMSKIYGQDGRRQGVQILTLEHSQTLPHSISRGRLPFPLESRMEGSLGRPKPRTICVDAREGQSVVDPKPRPAVHQWHGKCVQTFLPASLSLNPRPAVYQWVLKRDRLVTLIFPASCMVVVYLHNTLRKFNDM